MKNLLNQVKYDEKKHFERYLEGGKKVILSNREFCGLSISDFTSFYFEMHNGKLANSMVKFALTANCEASNTLLSLIGYQEFANDAFDEFFKTHGKRIVEQFRVAHQQH